MKKTTENGHNLCLHMVLVCRCGLRSMRKSCQEIDQAFSMPNAFFYRLLSYRLNDSESKNIRPRRCVQKQVLKLSFYFLHNFITCIPSLPSNRFIFKGNLHDDLKPELNLKEGSHRQYAVDFTDSIFFWITIVYMFAAEKTHSSTHCSCQY